MASYLAAILAVMNAIGYGAAVWGFRASRRNVGEATWWFLLGFGIVAGAIILRGVYWDLALPLFRYFTPDQAAVWADLTRGRVVNNVFAVMKLGGIYCVLKCRQMLIPEDERQRWPVWRAWLHPNAMNLFWWWR